MRTIVLLCSLVAASGSLAAQQIVDHHPQETEAAASCGSTPDGSRRQVLDLEKEWVTAELKHDANTLRRILDDKFLASFEAGKPYGKDAFIQAIVSGELDPTESQTLTDEQVIVDRDTAVVVGTDTIAGTRNGKPYTTAARYTVTYIHRNGRWIALAEHLVKMPKAQ